MTLDLPPGVYTVSGTLRLRNLSLVEAAGVTCFIAQFSGPFVDLSGEVRLPRGERSGGDVEFVAMSGTFRTQTRQDLALRCAADGGDVDAGPFHLTATRVGSLIPAS